MMQFTHFIRKVFATKILLSGKFSFSSESGILPFSKLIIVKSQVFPIRFYVLQSDGERPLTPVLDFRHFLQASAPSTFGPLDHYKTARATKHELCRRTNFYVLYNKRNLTSSKCYAPVCHSHFINVLVC